MTTRRAIKRCSLMAGLCLVMSALVVHSADYLYRYVNDEGVTVINYSIPPEHVHKGYEILNTDGTVHEVVPRALTDEELSDQSSSAYQERVEAEEAERLRRWDESLLLRYSSIADIEAARDRALSELKIRISILRSNLRSLRAQVETNERRAADAERRGGDVPDEIVAAIDGFTSEIGETERSIKERESEIEVVEQGYQRDIERFAMLLDTVELRQKLSRSRQ
jgi:hypothetical protein